MILKKTLYFNTKLIDNAFEKVDFNNNIFSNVEIYYTTRKASSYNIYLVDKNGNETELGMFHIISPMIDNVKDYCMRKLTQMKNINKY